MKSMHVQKIEHGSFTTSGGMHGTYCNISTIHITSGKKALQPHCSLAQMQTKLLANRFRYYVPSRITLKQTPCIQLSTQH